MATNDYHLLTEWNVPSTLEEVSDVVETNRPYGFTIEAFGDFVGRCVWTFEQRGTDVRIVYDWKIRADNPLLRHLSFLLKPIFSMNHHWAMNQGEKSLTQELLRRRVASS
jgi:hypothetical protein